MEDASFWAWSALALMGAFHGINPGMGWLFAVALGMQERSRSAVWRSLAPLGLGHVLAVGAALVLTLLVGVSLPPLALRGAVGVVLIALGGYRLFRHRHPRFGGMRVGPARLTAWSFLMASAHGAGLMVMPVFMGLTARAAQSPPDEIAARVPAGTVTALAATLLHGGAYLLVVALVAWLVYEKLGVGILRSAWVNLDLIWAVALILTGAVTLLI